MAKPSRTNRLVGEPNRLTIHSTTSFVTSCGGTFHRVIQVGTFLASISNRVIPTHHFCKPLGSDECAKLDTTTSHKEGQKGAQLRRSINM